MITEIAQNSAKCKRHETHHLFQILFLPVQTSGEKLGNTCKMPAWRQISKDGYFRASVNDRAMQFADYQEYKLKIKIKGTFKIGNTDRYNTVR